jgi:hypothetical protein
MDQEFDPYLELLGIPKAEQPPNCYRLLSIPEYTSNKEVIANGAARQMQFLRRVGGDQYLDDVQKILNEISKVRILLLDDEKRAEYDQNLKAKERARSGKEGSDSFSASRSQSQFDLLAPAHKEMGRASAVQMIHLSGPKVGQTFSLHSRDITIGPSSRFDMMIPTRNGSTFKLEHEIDQWILSSEDTSFAINGRLVSGLTVIKDGDILRFSVEGPDLQFIEEIDLTRHLDTLGQYENVVVSQSNIRSTNVRSTSSSAWQNSSNSASRTATRSGTQRRQPQPTQAAPRKAAPQKAQRSNAAVPTRPHSSKLVKKPASQINQGIGGSMMAIANRALGRDKSFSKKTGITFDWQIGVFWLVVGCTLAAIATGVFFGWRG